MTMTMTTTMLSLGRVLKRNVALQEKNRTFQSCHMKTVVLGEDVAAFSGLFCINQMLTMLTLKMFFTPFLFWFQLSLFEVCF